MLLEKINNFARKLDNRVVQVSISLTGSYSHIQILKKDYENHADLRTKKTGKEKLKRH